MGISSIPEPTWYTQLSHEAASAKNYPQTFPADAGRLMGPLALGQDMLVLGEPNSGKSLLVIEAAAKLATLAGVRAEIIDANRIGLEPEIMAEFAGAKKSLRTGGVLFMDNADNLFVEGDNDEVNAAREVIRETVISLDKEFAVCAVANTVFADTEPQPSATETTLAELFDENHTYYFYGQVKTAIARNILAEHFEAAVVNEVMGKLYSRDGLVAMKAVRRVIEGGSPQEPENTSVKPSLTYEAPHISSEAVWPTTLSAADSLARWQQLVDD